MINSIAKIQKINSSKLNTLSQNINVDIENVPPEFISDTKSNNSLPNLSASLQHPKFIDLTTNSSLHLQSNTVQPKISTTQSEIICKTNFTPVSSILENEAFETCEQVQKYNNLPQCEPQCEPGNLSIKSPSTSRDSTSSPVLQKLQGNKPNWKNKNSTYLEHSLATLSDSLQKRMNNQETAPQSAWSLTNLTPDKSFGLLVATELENLFEPEKSKRKQAIVEILYKPCI